MQWKHPIHFLAYGFGSGLMPVMPGTFGTLVGIGFLYVLSSLDPLSYAAVVLVGGLLGIFICEKTAKNLGKKDPGSIVWDEIIGYLVTMFMVPKEWIWILIGFILFSALDILKPWPISSIDRRVKGGFGIMLDDVVAALFSLAIIQTVIYFYNLYLV